MKTLKSILFYYFRSTYEKYLKSISVILSYEAVDGNLSNVTRLNSVETELKRDYLIEWVGIYINIFFSLGLTCICVFYIFWNYRSTSLKDYSLLIPFIVICLLIYYFVAKHSPNPGHYRELLRRIEDLKNDEKFIKVVSPGSLYPLIKAYPSRNIPELLNENSINGIKPEPHTLARILFLNIGCQLMKMKHSDNEFYSATSTLMKVSESKLRSHYSVFIHMRSGFKPLGEYKEENQTILKKALLELQSFLESMLVLVKKDIQKLSKS